MHGRTVRAWHQATIPDHDRLEPVNLLDPGLLAAACLPPPPRGIDDFLIAEARVGGAHPPNARPAVGPARGNGVFENDSESSGLLAPFGCARVAVFVPGPRWRVARAPATRADLAPLQDPAPCRECCLLVGFPLLSGYAERPTQGASRLAVFLTPWMAPVWPSSGPVAIGCPLVAPFAVGFHK